MTAYQPSPEILSVDLLRVQMESMTIEELQEHIEALRQAVLGLVQSKMMRPHISPQSAANIERLRHKCQRRLKSDPLSCKVAEVNLTHPGSFTSASRSRRAKPGAAERRPRHPAATVLLAA